MSKAAKIAQTFNGAVDWQGMHAGYFKLLTAASVITLELMRNGQTVLSATGIPAGYYQRIEFDHVRITNPVNQVIEWLYGPDEGGSDRLAGEVSVIDGGKSITLAGNAFLAPMTSGAVAANFSHCQLWNPAASGLRAIVKGITSIYLAAMGVHIRRHNAALTTLAGNPQSKYLGGAASTLESRTQALAAGTGTLIGLARAPANGTDRYEFQEPVIVPPGQGLVIHGDTLNTELSVTYDFYTEPNT